MNHCSGKAVDLIEATYLGSPGWELRGRLHPPAEGRETAFAGRGRRLSFHRGFWESLNAWAEDFARLAGEAHPATTGPREPAWFGEVGTMACNRPSAAHNRARGFDLCHIRFANGDRVDMNASHRGDRTAQRLYLATAASLRRSFGTVLTCWYNAEHADHLHVDDLTAVHPMRATNRTDTTLIQAACRLLDGDDQLMIDGVWDQRTDAALARLLDSFDLASSDPRHDVDDAIELLTRVARSGLADQDAASVGASLDAGLVWR